MEGKDISYSAEEWAAIKEITFSKSQIDLDDLKKLRAISQDWEKIYDAETSALIIKRLKTKPQIDLDDLKELKAIRSDWLDIYERDELARTTVSPSTAKSEEAAPNAAVDKNPKKTRVAKLGQKEDGLLSPDEKPNKKNNKKRPEIQVSPEIKPAIGEIIRVGLGTVAQLTKRFGPDFLEKIQNVRCPLYKTCKDEVKKRKWISFCCLCCIFNIREEF